MTTSFGSSLAKVSVVAHYRSHAPNHTKGMEDERTIRIRSVHIRLIQATRSGPLFRLPAMLLNAGLWPSLGPERLLDQLSLHSRCNLSHDWQQMLTRLAEEASAHQRLTRLRELSRPEREVSTDLYGRYTTRSSRPIYSLANCPGGFVFTR